VKDAIAQDARVVDEDVDAAEGVDRGLDDLVGVARLADRQRRGDGLAAGFFDLVDDVLCRTGIGPGAVEACADVAGHDARAFLRHQERNAAADAPPRSGDDGDLTGDDVRHA
jgi:hypothetical protein